MIDFECHGQPYPPQYHRTSQWHGYDPTPMLGYESGLPIRTLWLFLTQPYPLFLNHTDHQRMLHRSGYVCILKEHMAHSVYLRYPFFICNHFINTFVFDYEPNFLLPSESFDPAISSIHECHWYLRYKYPISAIHPQSNTNTPVLQIDKHESLDNRGILILVMYCKDFMQRRL